MPFSLKRILRGAGWAALLALASSAVGQISPPVKWHSDGFTNAYTTFSRDGSTLLVASGGYFSLFNTTTGALIASAYTGGSQSYALSNNGSQVYFGNTQQLFVFNVATESVSAYTISGLNSYVYNLCVSEDGTTLGFTGTYTATTVYLFSLATNTVTKKFNISVPNGQYPASLSFLDSGQELVVDGPTIYSTAGKRVGGVTNNGPVTVSPDETTLYTLNTTSGKLVSYSSSNLAVNWSITTPSYWHGPAPSSDGKAIYLSTETAGNWYVQGYSTANGASLQNSLTYSVPTESGYDTPSICASPTANVVFLGPGSQESTGLFANMNSSTGVGSIAFTMFEGNNASAPYSVLAGTSSQFVANDQHDSWAYPTLRSESNGEPILSLPTNALCSPDALYYLIQDASTGNLDVCSTQTGKIITYYNPGSNHQVFGCGWAQTSGQLYVLNYNGSSGTTTVYLLTFSGTALKLIASIAGANSQTSGVFTGDGNHIALVYTNSSPAVLIYSTSTGKLTGTINPDTSSDGIQSVYAAKATLIGVSEFLTGGNYANEFRVFDVSTTPTKISGVTYFVPAGTNYIAGTLSPDGRYIAMLDLSTNSPDPRTFATMHLFRVSDGAGLQTWSNVPNAGNGNPSLCFSTDSSTLAFWNQPAMFAFNLPPTKLSLTLASASVAGGATTTGTVTIDQPAPVATTITLGCASKAVSVPASVTIAAGATTATFTVTTSGVDAATTANVTALDSVSAPLNASAPLTVNPATALTLGLNPATVSGGSPSTGTITLNALAGPSGVTVNLSSSSANATVPASVTVASGATTATFTVTTTNPSANTTATITGKTASYSGSAVLTINQSATVQLSFSSATVVGGSAATLTVSLLTAAPTGGSTFSLSASNTALTPRASVTVPAGSKTVSIGIPSIAVGTNTAVTLSASSGSTVAGTAAITVTAPVVTSVVPSGTAFVGPITAYALVVLNGPAPSNFTLTGSSSNAAISFTTPVPITAGQTFAFIPLTISAVTKSTPVSITIGGKSTTIVVLP